MSGIRFWNGTTGYTYKGAIFYQDKASFGRGDLIFANNNGASAGNASASDARMVIQYDGDVGIGTTTPQNKLDVEGGAVIGATYSGSSTAPSNGLLVQGNVGIGDSTPDYKLDVAGTVGIDNFIYKNSDADNYFGFTANGITFTMNGSWRVGIYDNTTMFENNVDISGTLTKGSGSFLIDHPLDPKNKVLRHSFVESPEMLNIYKGNAVSEGKKAIVMPDWFVALNGNNIDDYSFNITPLNDFCGDYYVDNSQIASKGEFTVYTEKNCEFSWIVYGVRHDKFALENPIIVEEEKPVNHIEKGKYVHPEVWE